MAKLRVKFGSAEVEYEGETEFDAKDIENIFIRVSATKPPPQVAENAANSAVPNGTFPAGNSIQMHTDSIAAKLGGKAARDLALASSAHLQIVHGKATFTRRELTEDMRGAPSRFSENMVKNMSATLKSLIDDGKLNKVSADAYSLSDTARREIEAKLAA